MKIAYEKHPVSPERKAELRGQGYKILDARFAPKGEEPVEHEPQGIPSKSDIAIMKKADCIEWLDAHGADTDGTIAELRSRLRAVMYLEG